MGQGESGHHAHWGGADGGAVDGAVSRGGGDPLRAGRRGGERGVLHAPWPDEADLRPAGVRLLRLWDDQEVLDAIEAFEDAQNAPGEAVSNEELTATSLASIAASLEYQNMLTLDDAEVV